MKGLWLSVLVGLLVLRFSAVSQAQPLILGEGDQSGVVVKAFHRPFGGSLGGSFRSFGHRHNRFGFGNRHFGFNHGFSRHDHRRFFDHDRFGFDRGFRKGFRFGFREGLRFDRHNRIIVIDPFDRFDRFDHFDDWNRNRIHQENWSDSQRLDDPSDSDSENNFDDQVNDNFDEQADDNFDDSAQ